MGEFRGLSRLVSSDLGPHTLPQQSTVSTWDRYPPSCLVLPSIGWQLFILDSSQSDSTAFPSCLDK
jgi:hypothetical protein